MNGERESDLYRQEGTGHRPRITAKVTRTERGELFTEYTVDGDTYQDVEAVASMLRGGV